MLVKLCINLCVLLHKTGAKVLGRQIAELISQHAIGASVAALGSAWIPGAGGTAALLASGGFVWSMYYRIGSKIGMPFTKNILKSVATGVCTNIATSVVATFAASTLLSLIPGGGIASSVIMAFPCFALTWASGSIYIKTLTLFAERNIDLSELSEEELGEATKSVLADCDVDELMAEAKREFKAAKAKGQISKNASTVSKFEDDEEDESEVEVEDEESEDEAFEEDETSEAEESEIAEEYPEVAEQIADGLKSMRCSRLFVMNKIPDEKLAVMCDAMDTVGLWYAFIDTSKTGNFREGLGVTGDVVCLKARGRPAVSISLGENLDIYYQETKLFLGDYTLDLRNAMSPGQVKKLANILAEALGAD